METPIRSAWTEAQKVAPNAVVLHAGQDKSRPVARLNNWNTAKQPRPAIWVRLTKPISVRSQEYSGFSVLVEEGSFGQADVDTFACIRCSDEAFTELFLEFSQNLLRKLEDGVRPNKAVQDAIREWQAFFKKAGMLPLDREQLTGLFGELSLIEELLLKGLPAAQVLDGWTGPKGDSWDFNLTELGSPTLIEVKSTVRPSTQITVNSMDQLSPVPDFKTYLNFRMYEVVESENEHTHGTIVHLKLRLDAKFREINEPALIASVNEKLFNAGYTPAHDTHYMRYAFAAFFSRWHLVDESFPSLNRRSIPTNIRDRISKVRYTMSVADLEEIQPPV